MWWKEERGTKRDGENFLKGKDTIYYKKCGNQNVALFQVLYCCSHNGFTHTHNAYANAN